MTSTEKEIAALKRRNAELEAELQNKKKGELKDAIAANPDAFEGYGKEQYKDRKTGEVFRLKTLDALLVRHQKTHCVRSAEHYGEYTAEEFRNLFDKL